MPTRTIVSRPPIASAVKPQIGASRDCAANPSTTNDITRPKYSGRELVMISAWLTSITPVVEIPTRIATNISAKNDGVSAPSTNTSAISSPKNINNCQARRPETTPARGTFATRATTPTTRYSRNVSLAGTPKLRSMKPGSSVCEANRQTATTIQ